MARIENTKQMIIEKAAPIFNIQGIAATSMNDIAEATKLVKGSLYVHFENKEALANCVVNYNLKLFTDYLHSTTEGQENYRNKLIAFIEYFRDPLRPTIEGGCPIMNFGAEADDLDPVIRRQVYKTVLIVQEEIVSLIKKGIQKREFVKEWDAERFATKTFAMLEGAQLICRVGRSNDTMDVVIEAVKSEIDAMSIKRT